MMPPRHTILLMALMALIMLSVSLSGAQRATSSNADTLISRADVALQENQLEDALRLYQQAQKVAPSNAHVRVKIMEIQSILRSRPARPAAAATGGGPTAEPTASGSKGGATPVTENMPLDLASLLQIRTKRSNQPEFRGAWVTRNDWTSRNPGVTRANIVKIMKDAEAAGLNAVLFQVRGEAATLYPSPIEPWSRLLGARNPGFDPLKLAIDEAHKRGLEFHAYVNPCPCSDERNGPSDPNHVWFKHCQPDSNPHWLVHKNGKPAPFKEYYWFNPNLPEVQTYIRRAMLDLVARYQIDGIHYDRIRFPDSGVSDDPWSKARFAGPGNPGNLSWHEWQRDNITRMLTDIYGCIMAVNPRIKVSAAVWGIYDKTKLPRGQNRATGYSWTSTGLQDYNQDSIAWTNKGCVDALVPMIYWNMGGIKPDYDELLYWFCQNVRNGRHVYGGQAVFDKVELIREVVATNAIGAHGTVPFTLSKLSREGMVPFIRKNINPTAAPPPPMPWKENPKTGCLLVTVKDSQGVPIMDAHVRMPGRSDVWLSSADGFCAVIDADPGQQLTLSAEKAGVGSGTSVLFSVQAGKAVPVEIVMGTTTAAATTRPSGQ